jgi:FixJ family two-component response regulator
VSDEAAVFVVDDDPAVRDSIAMLVRGEGLEVKTFDSPRSLLAELGHCNPGCLIVDLRLPGLSGLELQEHLAGDDNVPPIIFLTGYGTVPAAVRALKAGAMDFLEKPFDPAVLLALVREALARDRARRADVHRLDTLTRREREVLGEVAEGNTNKVIAANLGISVRTVELHRARGMRKLGVRSVAELVRLMR